VELVPVFADSIKKAGYLAIGDSISLGLNPDLLPGSEKANKKPKADNFVGYPEMLAAASGLGLINISCPGETSASFLVSDAMLAPDNGCRAWKAEKWPLHIKYNGTQVDEIEGILTGKNSVDLITISLGEYDLLLVQQPCSTTDSSAFINCVRSKLEVVLPAYGDHLSELLSFLRFRLNYSGRIVLMAYHSPYDAQDPVLPRDPDALAKTSGIAALNGVMKVIADRVFLMCRLLTGFQPSTQRPVERRVLLSF
jgi:hypothetical protein